MVSAPVDDVPPETVRQLATVLAPLGAVGGVVRLTGGMFATSYRVTLAGGEHVVVKTAPTRTDRLLTYELDLVRSEAHVYSLAADRPDLLMPRVLLTDFSRSVLPSDVLVVAHLDGVPLRDAEELAPGIEESLQRELGRFMARLHSVHGVRFGYPNLDAGLNAATWPEAFGAMVRALLDDADRWGTPLPSADVRAALRRYGPELAEVTVPSLVHTDLWPANLFVDPATGTLTGVIDPERSVWGDPLLELAGMNPLGRGPEPAAVHAGYAEQGGGLAVATPSGAARLLLYRMYMSLVLLVEIAPRGYTGDWVEQHRTTAAANLRSALDELLEVPAATSRRSARGDRGRSGEVSLRRGQSHHG